MTESRNKGGRPTKPDAEKQSLTVRFRVTPCQMEILQRQAKENGCTLSEYARGMTLNGRVVAPISPERLALVAELTRARMSDQWIMRHIGMDRDELLRLKQITGLAELFSDKEFSLGDADEDTVEFVL